MLVTLSWETIRYRLKFGVKILLLALIICYILPKLFILFLNFGSPQKMQDQKLLEKPLRVMYNIKVNNYFAG